jgi:hypothetical protein
MKLLFNWIGQLGSCAVRTTEKIDKILFSEILKSCNKIKKKRKGKKKNVRKFIKKII